jgi:hypothetical protein
MQFIYSNSGGGGGTEVLDWDNACYVSSSIRHLSFTFSLCIGILFGALGSVVG